MKNMAKAPKLILLSIAVIISVFLLLKYSQSPFVKNPAIQEKLVEFGKEFTLYKGETARVINKLSP